MDEIVLRAMVKWPNVPALYGWLKLDRRGQWVLQGERVEHEPLTEFINRNYAGDAQGRWYFQNGPQRVYVTLEYAPWVVRVQTSGKLQTHTGQPLEEISTVLIDEAGNLLLGFDDSVGLLLDTDLDWAIGQLRALNGRTLSDEAISTALERLQLGEAANLAFEYQAQLLPIESVPSAVVAQRYRFQQEPVAEESEKESP